MDTQKFKEELVRQATIFFLARKSQTHLAEEAAEEALEVASAELSMRAYARMIEACGGEAKLIQFCLTALEGREG